MLATCCTITEKNTVTLVKSDKGRALEPHEIRIRTRYSLISPGTELAIFLGEHVGLSDPKNLFAKYPFAAGYAAVGEVIDTGSEVKAFSAGQQVYYEGAHESVAIVDAVRKNVRALPSGIDPKLVPFARLAQISSTALLMAELSAPSTIALVGLGLIGNLASQLLQLQGHRVLAADTVPSRRALALACGVGSVVETTGADLSERLSEAANGDIDLFVEATGNPAVVPAGLELVRSRGKVVLLGSPRGKADLDLYNHIHVRGVMLLGAHERLLRADPVLLRDTVDDMLRRIADHRLVVAPLITRVVQPHDLAEAYRLLHTDRHHTLGVLIDWAGI